jgi:hypothetical protein
MGRGAVTGDQMFLVVATKNAPTIQARMDEHGLTYHTLRPDTWVVLSAGTAPALAELIGVRGGGAGSGFVVRFSDYAGFAPKSLWDWISAHWPVDG